MNFKSILFFAFCCQISFAQLSDLTLNVMNQLNINEEDCDGSFAEMQLPYNTDETAIVIPKIGKQEEDFTALDSYVVLVNNKTKEIKSLFIESYETSGWQSDAIFIYDISIDTTSYLIDKNTNAFGVVLKSRSMSQPNPYYDSTISLFTPNGKKLKNILKNYPIYESIGETDMKCYGKFEIESRQLSISKNATNGFLDIVVDITNKTVVYEESKGECEDKVTSVQTEKVTLTYENEKYKQH
ncbi:hypothetical protein FF125_00890 [Aureibaculum algae]|uniref:Uncharacterized protein n=1 Tax=Aureibaculum algae TaxID=2584122 RepID=A0A5B7TNX2_9FLAO|nr:hypothetical protein [Aureibaculum algae]QCX37061.1 hypothetical protein FF125_00890 [Aureibaculum algae]